MILFSKDVEACLSKSNFFSASPNSIFDFPRFGLKKKHLVDLAWQAQTDN